MPRKTRRPRKAAKPLLGGEVRRQRNNPFKPEAHRHQKLDAYRRNRPDLRPMKFPGRLGGR